LTHVRLPTYREDSGDRPFQEKILMEGMSNQTPAQLVPLAKSWLQAPALSHVEGGRSRGYDPAQRAYVLAATDSRLSFSIEASEVSPLVNLCVLVTNWGCSDTAQVTVDQNLHNSGDALRQGIIRDPEGRQALVVWLEMTSTRPTAMTITGAKPRPLSAQRLYGGL
jgi:hypothetical protein